jgi:hypothetical protein
MNGESSSTHGRYKKIIFYYGNLRVRNHLEDVSVDEEIMPY